MGEMDIPISQKIAIVGIGCRYANGIDDVNDFVHMLREGLDCTGEVPSDRLDFKHFYYPDKSPGKIYCTRGGYIRHNIYDFDRQFFKMPPEEANMLDPQIRLLLEVTWESLENAGIPPSCLRGSNTGVYVGDTLSEHVLLCTMPESNINQYTNSGNNSCMASNRISYEFDFRGPSFSIDTACSSSLYAIHLACEAIRHGDCNLAVAGGINLIMSPATHIGFCQAGMLSPDGRSKSFDNSADGYARGDGAGMIVLKPLQKAMEDGDFIYTVIRGGALSNDGRTPGIANPSYDAQVQLVHRACKHARVDPHKIQYIEAHGTGTKVGDWTEASALGEALSKHRNKESDPQLFIGSVKSNFGHSEGAAGVAGVIKVALMQKYNFIPPVANFQKANENIPFKELQLDVPSELLDWPLPGEREQRYSGCSSFGFGGANAHLIFEEPPRVEDFEVENETHTLERMSPTILFLSADSKEALDERKKQFVCAIENLPNDTPLVDMAATSFLKAQHHKHRLAYIANSKEEVKLDLTSTINSNERCTAGVASDGKILSPIVFVFTGMGSQWWAMGRQLYQLDETFRDAIQLFDEVLQHEFSPGWSMCQMIAEEEDTQRINKTELAQPGICAIQLGLVHLLRKYGISPDAIVGHSVGEVAASYAAGMLTFENAVKVIYHRGQLLSKSSGYGKMLAVLDTQDEVVKRLDRSGLKNTIDIAAVNSPNQIVLSGNTSSIEQFAEILSKDGIRAVLLKVDNAFHSFQQDFLKEELLEKLSFLDSSSIGSQNNVKMISTVTANEVQMSQINNNHYWWMNVRQKVQFKDVIDAMLKEGHSTFLEVGPHPSLGPAIYETANSTEGLSKDLLVLWTLKRSRDTSRPANDISVLWQSLAKLHCEGYAVNFGNIYPEKRRSVHLPNYPWQRVFCSSRTQRAKDTYLFPHTNHYILGRKLESPEGERTEHTWKAELTPETVPWIMDHKIEGNVIAPATSYIEAALEATRQLQGHNLPLSLSDVKLKRFLFMPDCEATVQSSVTDNGEDKIFKLHSKEISGDWTLNMTCSLCPVDKFSQVPEFDIEEIKSRCFGPDSEHSEEIYGNLGQIHFSLGPSFRNMKQMWLSDDSMKANIFVQPTSYVKKDWHAFNVHPALLDVMLQTCGVVKMKDSEREAKYASTRFREVVYVPVGISKIDILSPPPEEFYIDASFIRDGANMIGDLYALDAYGELFCHMQGIVFRQANNDTTTDITLWTTNWENISLEDEMHNVDQADHTGSKSNTNVIVMSHNQNSGDIVGQHMAGKLTVDIDILPSDEDVRDRLTKKHAEANHIMFLPDTNNTYEAEKLISRENFKCGVFRDCVTLAHIAKHLAINPKSPKQNLWIITKGAFAISPKDTANPMAQATQSVGISTMHDMPDLYVYMVDLPAQDQAYSEALYLLQHLLLHPPKSENEFCVRWNEEQGISLFARRLKKWTPDALTTSCHNDSWAISKELTSNSITLVPAPASNVDLLPEKIKVQVKAFKFLQLTGESSFRALVAGTQEGTISSKKKLGKRFVGLTTDFVQASMLLDQRFCVKIPDKLSTEESVSCISQYLLPVVTATLLEGTKGQVLLRGGVEEERDNFWKLFRQLGLQAECEELPRAMGTSDCDAVVILIHSQIKVAFKGIQTRMKPLGKAVFIDTDGKMSAITRANIIRHNFVNTTIIENELGPDSPLSSSISGVMKTLLKKCQNGMHWSLHIPEAVYLADILADNGGHTNLHNKVVCIDDRPVTVSLRAKDKCFSANPSATYLVTGASRGFGLEILHWLKQGGAKHIAVLARNQPSEEVALTLDSWETMGVKVAWKIADVICPEKVANAIQQLKGSFPPIEGIFHGAAVYKDKWLQVTEERDWYDVLLPKAYGAYVLHQVAMKKNLPLKYFVMISSIVGNMGNAGQATYCAANNFLIGLGEMRTSMGLPATVVNFGIINTVGYAARNDLVSTWENKGLGSIAPSVALQKLGIMMKVGVSELGISGMLNLREYYKSTKLQLNEHFRHQEGRFSRLKLIFKKDVLENNQTGEIQGILDESPAKAMEIIHAKLTGFLAKRLGIADQETITQDNSPRTYGLDSLMSGEMSSYIGDVFQVSVPPVELLNDKNTLGKVEASIYQKMKMMATNSVDEVDHNSQYMAWQPEESDSQSRWLTCEKKLDNPCAILICVPPVGGGLSTYAGWQSQLESQGVQVYVGQMPGWEGRDREEPLKQMHLMIKYICQTVARVVGNLPFALYGHSFGSLLAFEMSHLLWSEQEKIPTAMFLSAWPGPHLYHYHQPVNQAIFDPSTPIKEAIRMARCFKFLEEDQFQNEAFMRHILPCIEASLFICRSYSCHHRHPLPADLYVYAARNDDSVPVKKVEAWSRYTHKDYDFNMKIKEGNHLFLLTPARRDELIRDIQRALTNETTHL